MVASSLFKVEGVVKRRFRLGIVGLSALRGWATAAHVPALRALSDDFEIVGVANTSLKSAEAAAAAFGLPRAFESAAAPPLGERESPLLSVDNTMPRT